MILLAIALKKQNELHLWKCVSETYHVTIDTYYFFICLILFDFDGIGTTYRTCQGIHCVLYVAF